MDDLETLKNKWSKVRETRSVDNFMDFSRLEEPGTFCLHIRDKGGPPCCGGPLIAPGFFDDARDALSYYRFAEIPRILQWDRGVREDKVEEAEFHLSKYDDTRRKNIEELLQLIDDALISENISKEQLGVIQKKYNDFFSTTEPENQILAWGSLGETLRSSFFNEVFKEDIEEEADDEDSEEYSTYLKELLDAGEFDENDDDHIELGAIFLERQYYC